MRNPFSKFWTWLAVPLTVAALAACTTTTTSSGGTVTTAWSPAQTAYVELATYQAAQFAALAVAQAPGLSAKAVGEIQAGEGIATGAITAQAQALAQGGDIEAQAVTAITTAASGAVSAISSAVAAQHGTTNADAQALGVAGGIAALSDAPQILMAIEKVRGGYQPTAADLAGLVDQISQSHQVLQAVGQPHGA